ncbi:hypothetical protein [Pelotomaculum sp. PtaB.Bin117]|uniref:hypothetical protein n=2 Tax=Pelotomaculum TaxID=191373 RepID=UPI00257CA7E2|nr:hypothetical protein [Pelotomaculum sp. PtaB.Bin117]
MHELPAVEHNKFMSKHKSHVDRRRNEYGNAVSKMRVKQMERLNKAAPLIEYNLENFSGKFEIYDHNKNKGRKKPLLS